MENIFTEKQQAVGVSTRRCARHIAWTMRMRVVAPRPQSRAAVDIDQALRQRFFRNVAMQGRDFQIPLKKCKKVEW